MTNQVERTVKTLGRVYGEDAVKMAACILRITAGEVAKDDDYGRRFLHVVQSMINPDTPELAEEDAKETVIQLARLADDLLGALKNHGLKRLSEGASDKQRHG